MKKHLGSLLVLITTTWLAARQDPQSGKISSHSRWRGSAILQA